MEDITLGTSKNATLEQLTQWVWGNECGHGPVIGIGHTNEGTAATFHYSLTEPTKKAEIRPRLPGQAIQHAGKALVCEGTVFVSGTLTQVVVLR